MEFFELSPIQWTCALSAAICIGLSKTGFGGVSLVAVLLMTQVMPARESTGAILPLLIVADIFAVRSFHQFTVWRHIIQILPPAVLGVMSGWLLMPHIPNNIFAPIIGWIVMVLLTLTIFQKFFRHMPATVAEHPAITWLAGWMAGVTTMLANSAGPVMTIYLLACRLPKYEFVATAAWYFFIVNVIKVPFSISLGLINPASLLLDLVLIPGIIIGVLAGPFFLRKIDQQTFEWLMIILSVAGGLRLIFIT